MTDGRQPSGVPLLEANVVAWNLPGPDGKVPPVGREALEKLSPVWAARLLEEVLKRNPFLTLVQTPPGSGKPSGV